MKYTTLLFALAINLGYAQVGNTYEEGAELQTGTISNPFLRASTNSTGEVEGSEFLNEEWEQATVIDLNINKKVRLLARFNAYTKEIELLKEKSIIALIPAKGVSVMLGGKTFVPAKLKNSTHPIFVEQLVAGPNGLYKYYDAKIVQAASDATLLNLENKDKIVITEKLYYGDTDGIQKLPSKKKSMESILAPEIVKAAKKERLSFKKEADLIRIFGMQ